MRLPSKIWVDSWYYLLKTQHFKRTVCLSLQNISYIFLLQGALSGRCSTAWGQNEISCQSNMLLSFVTACIKAYNMEASTALSFEQHGATSRNWIASYLWYALALQVPSQPGPKASSDYFFHFENSFWNLLFFWPSFWNWSLWSPVQKIWKHILTSKALRLWGWDWVQESKLKESRFMFDIIIKWNFENENNEWWCQTKYPETLRNESKNELSDPTRNGMYFQNEKTLSKI